MWMKQKWVKKKIKEFPSFSQHAVCALNVEEHSYENIQGSYG